MIAVFRNRLLRVNGGSTGTTWNAVGGSHTIQATVNPQKLFDEENFSNNSYSEKIVIDEPCDLIVTNIMVGPGNPIASEANTISATIKNIGQGSSPAGRTHRVDFYIGTSKTSSYWSDDYSWSIEPGESVTLTSTWGLSNEATWQATAGNQTLTAVIDGLNIIKESDETNNSFTKVIPVTETRVLDPNFDYDGDGLTTAQELLIGTDPLNADTDRDGQYDSTEIKMGTDPLTVDTNAKVTRTVKTSDETVIVTAYGDNNILFAPFRVIKSDNVILNGQKGIVGKSIEISMGGYEIDSADITFKYDVNQLNGVVGRFGEYLCGDSNMKIDLSDVDIVFDIDQSMSMKSSDPLNSRFLEVQKFVQNMDSLKNRVGMVIFNNSAVKISDLTNNKAALNAAINDVISNRAAKGITNIGDGLSKSRTVMNTDNMGNNRVKVIILLTDGANVESFPSDMYYQGYTNKEVVTLSKQINMYNIIIDTVGLAAGAKGESLLQEIASAGKGNYYSINSSLDIDDLYSKISNQIALKKSTREKFNPRVTADDVSQIKANLIKLGYTNVDTKYTEAINSFVGSYYDIDLPIQREYDKLIESERNVALLDWTNKALIGSITKGNSSGNIDLSHIKPEDVTRQIARWLIGNPVNAYLTQHPNIISEAIFYEAGFVIDNNVVYHARQNWSLQSFEYSGYNDFYDTVFHYGTIMDKAKFEFTSDKKKYILWAWKGDYLNLGAGAEMGIYKEMVVNGTDTKHWLVDQSLAMPMTLEVDYKGTPIVSYDPKIVDPQIDSMKGQSTDKWWVKSFNTIGQMVRDVAWNNGDIEVSTAINVPGGR